MKCSMADCQRAPMVTGLIRSPMCEAHVREALSNAFAAPEPGPVAWWQRASARNLPTRITGGVAR